MRVYLAVLFLVLSVVAYAAPRYLYQLWLGVHAPQVRQAMVTLPEESGVTAQSLSYYVQAQSLDPIFAIAGTDPDKLTASVDSLLKERDQIAGFYAPQDRSNIETSLYPAQFLKDLPGLEASRQTLLNNPTLPNANTYHIKLIQAVSDYVAGARALGQSLRSVSGTLPTLGYVGGSVTVSDYASKMDTIASTGLAQKAKEDARFLCLTNYSARCQSIASLQDTRIAKVNAAVQLPAPSSAVLKADALSKQILPLVPGFKNLSAYIVAYPSNCYGGALAYSRAYYLTRAGGTARKIDNVNNVYFYNVPNEVRVNPDVHLYQESLQKGITLQYQSMGNLYECADSGFDVSQIGSVIGTLEALQSASSTPAIQKALAQPVVQKADLAPIVHAAAQSTTTAANNLVERYIEGSADFDQVLLGAYSDNYFLIRWNQSEKSIAYNYMLTVRNFAPEMFFAGNPTFVPTPVSFFSSSTPNPLGKVGLREYLGDVSGQFTDAEIIAQQKSYFGLSDVVNLDKP